MVAKEAGYIGNLTAEQEKCLEEMRQLFPKLGTPNEGEKDRFLLKLKDPMERDALFLRYLRARKFDVEKAAEMLNNTLEWRISMGLNQGPLDRQEIQKDPESVPFLFYFGGKTKDGVPVCYQYLSYMSFHKADVNKAVRYLVSLLEELVDQATWEAETWTVVLDCSNSQITFSNLRLDVVKSVTGIFDAHYPERLHIHFFVNLPWLLKKLWSIVSPFFDKRTLEKFVFAELDTLQTYIDPCDIPTHLGGTKELDIPKMLGWPCNYNTD